MGEKLVISEISSGFLYEGPRFEKLGPNSGEVFRDKYLIPFLNKLDSEDDGIVDFAGTKVFSPSFLEESFGGAVRCNYGDRVKRLKIINMPDDIKKDVVDYIKNAIASCKRK